MKMSPAVIAVIMLTMVALIPPLVVLSLGIGKYWKERSHVEKTLPAGQTEVLRQMVETAANKQFEGIEKAKLSDPNEQATAQSVDALLKKAGISSPTATPVTK
ncbi:MAG: hypothetical protein ABIP97_03250 [Chthoniobacterales bacterium]